MRNATLTIGKTEISYVVRASDRAKRKRIVVTPGVVEVVVPIGIDDDAVRAFIHAKRRWVFDKVREVAVARNVRETATTTWAAGGKIFYRGRNIGLRVQLAAVENPVVVFGPRIEVRLPTATRPEARERATQLAVETWMRDRARVLAKALVRRFAQRLGVVPRRVEVRSMPQKWGACGKDGIIRIDASVMRLPAHLAEYLAAHETVHLLHRDHSAAFWRVLRTLLPDARIRHAELLAAGRSL